MPTTCMRRYRYDSLQRIRRGTPRGCRGQNKITQRTLPPRYLHSGRRLRVTPSPTISLPIRFIFSEIPASSPNTILQATPQRTLPPRYLPSGWGKSAPPSPPIPLPIRYIFLAIQENSPNTTLQATPQRTLPPRSLHSG